MTKFLGFVLFAIACWTPDVVLAASRWAVCSTACTWDNTSTAMWSSVGTGGATGASAPVAADDVIIDAATCVGGTTCTITTFAGTISISTLTQSACTASTAGCILDASANNTNFTIGGGNAYINTGAGTRTLNMGSGTWTLSGNSPNWNIVASATLNAGTSTISFSSTAGSGTNLRTFITGGKTYSTVTFAGNATTAVRLQGTGATVGTLTIGAPNRVYIQNITLTATTMTNISGSSSTPVLFISDSPNSGPATISSANNWTCDWCGFTYMTFSGGGTFSGTNSLNFGSNTGITITPPSGGATPKTIGG